MIPSNVHTSPPPAPSHTAAPAGDTRETEKGPQYKIRRPSGTRVCSARPYPSTSSGCVTRSQSGKISARTLAAKKPIAAPCHRAPDETHHPHNPHSPPTDHSGATTATTKMNWASATAQRQQPPTTTSNITGDCNRNRT